MTTAATRRSRRRLIELTLISLLGAVVAAFVLPAMPAVANLNLQVGDRLATLDQPHPLDDFVFVAIDDDSIKMDHLWEDDIAASSALTAMSRGWPWSRDVYAAAVERLASAGARLIVLDLVLGDVRPGDEVLREVLDRHADRVILGANLSSIANGEGIGSGQTAAIHVPASSLIPEGAADSRVGYVNFFTDQDGVIRSVTFRRFLDPTRTNSAVFHSLTSRALSSAGQQHLIPNTEVEYPFRYGDIESLDVVPFWSIFTEADWGKKLGSGEFFRDKIVVIGPSATILQDFHSTPIAARLPGPAVHINAIAAALGSHFWFRAHPTINLLLTFLASFAALPILWKVRHPFASLIWIVGLASAYLVACYIVAQATDILISYLYPTSALMIAGVGGLAWNFSAARRESNRMRSTLERYVSRNVVREILDHRDDFLTALGGTRRAMTIFFSDVRGFTTLAEKREATELVNQVNEYLAAMVRIIFHHNGTVDKFMGDGIMAVWGNVVSVGVSQDARSAALAALEMLRSVSALNADWETRDMPVFKIGIGLHHGEAVFGNIGSDEKMEPTVIGDAVNLASRTEGLTKKYGVPICVTGPCAALLGEEFRLRAVDLIQVVGKSQPVEMFALAGLSSDPSLAWIDDWNRAIRSFRSRQFAEAADLISSLPLANDHLAEMYIARCANFLTTPPPEDWNGSEIAQSK